MSSTSRSESIQVGPRAASQSGLGRPFAGDWGRRGPSLFRQRRSSRLPKRARMANFPGKGGSDGKERNLLKAMFSSRFPLPKANLPLEQPGPWPTEIALEAYGQQRSAGRGKGAGGDRTRAATAWARGRPRYKTV